MRRNCQLTAATILRRVVVVVGGGGVISSSSSSRWLVGWLVGWLGALVSLQELTCFWDADGVANQERFAQLLTGDSQLNKSGEKPVALSWSRGGRRVGNATYVYEKIPVPAGRWLWL